VLSLKSLPNILPRLPLKIGIHQVINKDANDGTPEQIINCIEFLLRDTLGGFSGGDIHHVHGGKPQGGQLTPPLKVGTIGLIAFAKLVAPNIILSIIRFLNC
jgi:hypothetical protein